MSTKTILKLQDAMKSMEDANIALEEAYQEMKTQSRYYLNHKISMDSIHKINDVNIEALDRLIYWACQE